MLTTSVTEQLPFLLAYSQNYAVLNIVGVIIITRAVLGFRGFRVSRFVMSCVRIG